MTLVLGLVAVLQMVFVPGYLFLKCCKIERETVTQTLAYGFGLSLFLNYIAVCLLTFLGIYLRPVVGALVGAEFLFLGWMVFKDHQKRVRWNVGLTPSSLGRLWRENHWMFRLSFAGAAIVAASLFYYLYKNFGTVFMFGDEIGSYNGWSIQWLKNKFPDPSDTMGYPINICANWSLTYLLMGQSDLHFFNRIMVTFFPMAVVALLFDLAWRTKEWAYLLAVFIFGALLRLLLPRFIGVGLMDLPVACCAFIAFHVMVDATITSPSPKKVVLVSLFTALAATIKQAGLFFLPFALGWSAVYLYKHRKKFSQKTVLRTALLASGVFIFGALSWYLWIKYQIFQGRSTNESTFLMKGIHRGRDLPERLVYGFKQVFGGGPIYDGQPVAIAVAYALALLGAASVFYRRSRLPSIFFFGLVVPYFFLWAFFFSYEVRTIGLLIPFWAYAAAFGAAGLLKNFPAEFRAPKSATGWFFTPKTVAFVASSVFALFAVLGFTLWTPSYLVDRQQRLQKEAYDAPLNQKLYAYIAKNRITGKIASHYGYIRWLPEFREYYFLMRGATTFDYIRTLEKREDIHYFLVRSLKEEFIRYFDDETLKYFKTKVADGTYEHIFDEGVYQFFKIKRH